MPLRHANAYWHVLDHNSGTGIKAFIASDQKEGKQKYLPVRTLATSTMLGSGIRWLSGVVSFQICSFALATKLGEDMAREIACGPRFSSSRI